MNKLCPIVQVARIASLRLDSAKQTRQTSSGKSWRNILPKKKANDEKKFFSHTMRESALYSKHEFAKKDQQRKIYWYI